MVSVYGRLPAQAQTVKPDAKDEEPVEVATKTSVALWKRSLTDEPPAGEQADELEELLLEPVATVSAASRKISLTDKPPVLTGSTDTMLCTDAVVPSAAAWMCFPRRPNRTRRALYRRR